MSHPEPAPDLDALRVGDVLRLRRPHPCGATEWTVQRIGTDVGLRCHGCERRVMLSRAVLRRRVAMVVSRGGEAGAETRAAVLRAALERGDAAAGSPGEPGVR